MSISIIIPVYNEEDQVKITLNKLNNFKKKIHDIEIIFVDDDSTDGTVKTLKEFAKKNSDIRVISRFQEKNYSRIKIFLLKVFNKLLTFSILS